MNKKMIALTGLVCLAAFAPSLQADDFYWIGPNEGNYTNALNWSKNDATGAGEHAVPGKLDKAIFNPGDGQTLIVTNTGSTGDGLYIYIKDISILSGTLNLVSPRVKDNSGDYYPHIKATDDVTNTLYVAEGSVFNSYYRYYPTTSGKGIVLKTGKGAANMNCNAWTSTTSGYRVQEFIIAEGTLTHVNRYAQNARYWRVRDGAYLNAGQYSLLRGGEIFSIDRGGKVRLDEIGSQYKFSGIEGEGELVIDSASGEPAIRLYLNGGPFRYTGKFTSTAACWFRNYYASSSFPANEDARHFPVAAAQMYDLFKAYYAGTAPEFDPGIHTFYLPPLMSDPGIPFVTQDTDGEPIALHANIYAGAGLSGSGFTNYNAVAITGPGEWWPRSGKQCVTGNQVRVTGKVGVPSGVTLKFGNGVSADADVTNFPFVVENSGTVVFSNVAARTVSAPFANAGSVTAAGPITLTAYKTTANTTGLTADGATLTLAGSSVDRSSWSVIYANGGEIALAGPRVEVSAPKATSANARNTYHESLKAPAGRSASGATAESLLTITNGAAFHFGAGSVAQMPNTLVADGGRLFIRASGLWQGPNAGMRAITLDGGSLEFPPCFSTYAANFLSSVNTDNMRLCLGEKGGVIGAGDSSRRGRFASAMEVDFNCAVVSEPGLAGTDGGLKIDCGTAFLPVKPWTITGPVTMGDARFHVSASWGDTGTTAGEPFGTGDFVMATGAWLSFGDSASAKAVRAASGMYSNLRLDAHGRISIDAQTGQGKRTAPLVLAFGAAGRGTSALSCGEHGALTLENTGDLRALHDKFSVKVEGGVPLHADGRTKAPLFFRGGYYTDFLTCDANNCLTNFNGYVSGFSGGADSTAFVGTNDTYTLESGVTQVGAVKFYLNGDTMKNVKIPADATLKVGNGTDPAIVLFQLNTSWQTYLPFDGAGTIDFGASKGWFVYPRKNNALYTNPVRLTTKVSGTGGLVFSGVNANCATDNGTSVNATFSLETANDWTGGTMIDMVTVKVSDKDALSAGSVTVRGSRMGGGSVVFGCEGPFANDFEISRFGREYCCYYNTYFPDSMSWNSASHGALEFESVGTHLTGTVTVADHSRISSLHPADGTEVAVFEGEVKGAHLEIVDMNPNDFTKGEVTFPSRRHKFVFCCDNHSLTGGVDVLNGATAVLRGANPSLGTGTIAMADGGTLRFENTADLRFTNKVEGVGLFQLGGEKEVVFAGDYSELDSGLIDLCGLRHEFAQVPPFALTNTTGRATIAFKGDLGTVDASTLSLLGEPKGFDLAIGAGTLLDLGGQTLTVRRLVEGTTSSQIVNGTLVETKPKQGLLLLVR